ncbi:GTP 3',8-cyclase MoaA [Eionea flava]
MTQLIDRFNRKIDYLRLSVTDRCDFRCVYCMPEKTTFLPRKDILSIEEMGAIARQFVELGVKKIRLTGGEPLIRNGIEKLFKDLATCKSLQTLTLTTNGSHLDRHIDHLLAANITRINVSLDSLQERRFQQLTRTGNLHQVLSNIDLAVKAGIKVKLNSVILKGRNNDEVLDLTEFALRKSLDISFIEEMPLGHITEHQRDETFVSSAALRQLITQKHRLTPSQITTGGPSRYWSTPSSSSLIGFISPHSDNFCSSCNRLRLTVQGRLLLCLGNEDSVDLKTLIRRYPDDDKRLKQTIIDSLNKKPEKHHFDMTTAPDIVRFMNATGG